MCICIYQLILLREKDYEPQAQPGQGLNPWQLDFHDRTFHTIELFLNYQTIISGIFGLYI